MPVEQYRVCGVPPWLPDWQEFWRVAWSVRATVLARGGTAEEAEEEARSVLYEVRDHTPAKKPSWPWTNAELERMVARAAKRQDAVDGEFDAEFGPVIEHARRYGLGREVGS